MSCTASVATARPYGVKSVRRDLGAAPDLDYTSRGGPGGTAPGPAR